jgi:NADP-dependent 3-hydroxy acid dehydrogenase YdfG
LAGKVAIVTGAAEIGRAIAERFAAAGARVVVADRQAAAAETVAALIVAAGGEAIVTPVDIGQPPQVEQLFAATIAAFGSVDVLVNNAALVKTERHILEADLAWWEEILTVNLSGAFQCSLLAAQIMASRRSGSIINLSSGGATRAHRGNVAYDAAKSGIESMTRTLALDLCLPSGVKRARGENIPSGVSVSHLSLLAQRSSSLLMMPPISSAIPWQSMVACWCNSARQRSISFRSAASPHWSITNEPAIPCWC